MASLCAVLITAYFHVFLRMSVFIRQEPPLFKEVPSLASWLFLFGLLDIIWHTKFSYIQYVYLPPIVGYAVETLTALFLTEFSLLVVWTKLENICCAMTVWLMIKINCYPSALTPYVLGFTTTLLSAFCILSLAIAADRIYFLRKRGRIILRRIQDLYEKLRKRAMENKSLNYNNEVHLTKDCITPKRTRHNNCPRCRQKRYNNSTPC